MIRIMHPFSVRDFRLRKNDFEYYPDIEIYDEFEDRKLSYLLDLLQKKMTFFIMMLFNLKLKRGLKKYFHYLIVKA